MTERNSGWILYDGQCAFCRGWVARGYRILRRRGYKFAMLQAPWVVNRFGLAPAGLLTEMRLVKPDGRTLGGADALIELAHAIWWAAPVYWIGRLPGALCVLRAAYLWLALRRHCLRRTCDLPPATAGHGPDHSISSGFYELP